MRAEQDLHLASTPASVCFSASSAFSPVLNDVSFDCEQGFDTVSQDKYSSSCYTNFVLRYLDSRK